VPFTVVTSSVNLGPASLGRVVSHLVRAQGQVSGVGSKEASPQPSAAPDTSASSSQKTVSGLPRSLAGLNGGKLEGCVTRVAAGGQVRLVDVGRYQGRPAIIIVVAPAAGGPSKIVVTGTACSATDPHVIISAPLSLPG
jgi:hypothetical protein